MLNELRYAFRALRRAPAFTLMASLTLALGIGANTAIFSVVWQVLLKPLPVPDADRVVVIAEAYGPNRRLNPVAPGNYHDWRNGNRSFEAVAAFNQFPTDLNLTGAGEPRQVRLTYVTGDFFNIVRMRPLAGRPIRPDDAERGRAIVVLGERLWRAAFGADPSVVGRNLTLSGETYEVIGVMPDEAGIGTQRGDAWTWLPMTSERTRVRQAHYLGVVARLRPGVTVEQANDDVAAIAARAAAEFPASNRDTGARVRSLREQISGNLRQPMFVLLGAAGLVLLIACANITGLQLARHAGRARDTAIRAALGATPLRLFREFLAEGLVLAAAGAYAGLLLAVWILATLGALAPGLAGNEISARPDALVGAFALLLSIGSGLAVAAIPGWRAASPACATELTSRGTAAGGGARLRSMLVAIEVALAVVVLTGATLLVSSLIGVLRVDPGFTFDSGLVVDLALPRSDYPDAAARVRFFERAIERANGLPGVEGACVINDAPLEGGKAGMTYVAEGQSRMVFAMPSTVSPGCLAVLGVPLQRGRPLTAADTAATALVSEATAREMWPNDDPIGKRMHLGLPDGPLVTVMGVVGNIHHVSLESSFGGQVWMPYTYEGFPARYLMVRVAGDPASVAPALRQAIRELDPKLPFSRVRTMADLRASVLAPRRFNMLLLTGYGLAALSLCAVGIYGLLVQVVGHRTQEIGVRMALGAEPSHVVRQVTGATAVSVMAGAVAGAGAAALLSRLVRHMLFGVSPTDPVIYIGVVLLVMTVALASAYIPARRATRIDPLVALRDP